MRLADKLYFALTRFVGRRSGRFYFEDFVRVYPDGVVINRLGIQRPPSVITHNNYLNHRKFYEFAAQFASGKKVADLGCGSGYGCDMLKQAGAAAVFGCDLSKHAIGFARTRFPQSAEFSVQGITGLAGYADTTFDVTISNEVLEHVKEYGRERDALREMRRVTRIGGLIVIGTPNTELTGDHGFSFDEIDALLAGEFERYVVFENALVPLSGQQRLWEARNAAGRTGVIVSQRINLAETVLRDPETVHLKEGVAPGVWRLGERLIDTTLLHNTHSWVVVALVEE